jgi:hypothetical protein
MATESPLNRLVELRLATKLAIASAFVIACGGAGVAVAAASPGHHSEVPASTTASASESDSESAEPTASATTSAPKPSRTPEAADGSGSDYGGHHGGG